MYAIIETGGKQYKVTEGDTLFIEKLEAEANAKITFDKVLAVLNGDSATFGAPVVEGASVDATVVKNGKGKKIRIFKYTPKKGYRKRQGHRQPYTKVQINGTGSPASGSRATAAALRRARTWSAPPSPARCG